MYYIIHALKNSRYSDKLYCHKGLKVLINVCSRTFTTFPHQQFSYISLVNCIQISSLVRQWWLFELIVLLVSKAWIFWLICLFFF